jgi:hypothetical protein
VIRLALMALCAAACAPLPKANATLPRNVTTFIERREACDHFRGEEPYDTKRLKFLNKAMARTCTGSDAKLRKLRIKYVRNALVMDALKNYDDDIEPETLRSAAGQ